MNVILTGGEGLIGRSLRDALHAANIPCYLLDTDYKSHEVKYATEKTIHINNKNEISTKEHFTFIHLAALTDVRKCGQNKDWAVEANVKFTKECLDFCTSNDIDHFIFFSSTLLYGVKDDHFKDEKSSIHNLNVYIETKIKAEELIQEYSNQRSWNGSTSIIRLSNVFGIESKSNSVLGRILHQIYDGEKTIEIYNAKPSRDFIYVKDICGALVKMIQSKIEYRFHIFNLATGISTEVRSIFKTLDELVGGLKLVETKDDVPTYQAINNNKFKQQFDWQPAYSIKDAMKEILEHNLWGKEK